MPQYLLDSNFFITAHRFHYPFDMVPSFWTRVQDLVHQGLIGSIDKVANEIVHGNDVLSNWIANHLPNGFFQNSALFINEYVQVAQWAHSKAGHYTTGALNEFLHADEADAWLVSAAMNRHVTLVTHEVSRPDMQRRVAIPEPCDYFGVSFCNTIEMFRRLGVSF